MRKLIKAINDSIAEEAHQKTTKNRTWLMKSPSIRCTCIFCGSDFVSADIKEWVDDWQTALCPGCGIDAVTPANEKYTKSIKAHMREYWFSRVGRERGGFMAIVDMAIRVKNSVVDRYYDLHSFISRHYRDLRRAYEYAKRGYRSYDWDFACLIGDMAWKLRKLGDCIKDNHYVENAELTYQQTHEAAKYLDLLIENPELDAELERIYKEHPPLHDTFMSERENHEEFSAKLRKYWEHREEEYQKNLNKAFDIIKENHRNWWD